jgi:hypothetical protein
MLQRNQNTCYIMLHLIGSIAIFKYDTTSLDVRPTCFSYTYLRLEFEIRVAVYAFAWTTDSSYKRPETVGI